MAFPFGLHSYSLPKSLLIPCLVSSRVDLLQFFQHPLCCSANRWTSLCSTSGANQESICWCPGWLLWQNLPSGIHSLAESFSCQCCSRGKRERGLPVSRRCRSKHYLEYKAQRWPASDCLDPWRWISTGLQARLSSFESLGFAWSKFLRRRGRCDMGGNEL